ncbi:hypothetical protein C5167_007460 [Papaver somniferum]|nr:hypothetical protein C5167_007460 [Papaver somniferum]
MIRVMWSRRDSDARKSGIANLFVKNLSVSIDNAKLHEMFFKYENILSCKVAMTEEGKSKGYGFVQYETEESATAATNSVNGSTAEGKQIYVGPFVKKRSKVLYVGRAQKKAEREKILHDQFERRKELQKIKGSNVYVKNIDDSVNDDELSSIFSKCGTITSAMIMLDEKGITKGFGFVCFTIIETSYQVVNDLHGILLTPLLGLDL